MLLTLTLLATFQEAQGLRPLEAMDLFELEGVSSPAVSPDGSMVLYSRVGFDVMNDRQRRELWLFDVESGDSRPLVDGVGSARWSPDGRYIAYVTGTEQDGAEVFVRWMDDGTTRQVTRLPRSPGSLRWAPDSRRIAFTMNVPRESKPLASMPSKPAGAEWAPAPKVVEQFRYRADGGGYLEDTDRQVFVVDAMGGTARQLTDGPADHGGGLMWADDETLVFSANLREDRHDHPNDTDLWSIRVADGELTKLTFREGPDGGAALDAASGTLFWTGFDDRRQGHQQREIYARPLGGGDSQVLTEGLDRSPGNLIFDQGSLYFSFVDEGRTRVGVTSPGGGVEILDIGLHGMGSGRPYSSGEFHVAGGTMAWVGGDPAWPGELHVARQGQAPRQVTDVNADLRTTVELGAVEEMWTETSADGLRVQSWVITPPGFEPDRTHPLILEIHGGPFSAYGPAFTFELQLMAAQGYVVVYGNPRGSTSYGETFANRIHHAYPSQDYDDLMGMVDAVMDRGIIDKTRLFVTGGSGGGVLTAWIVGTTDRFRAAVVAKPVINWISFALTADAYDFFWQYWFPGAPWDHFEHYWERSPLSRVGNVTTPTMLLTGEQDFRTPISESEQYYQALKIQGVETAMVRIPEAGHGIARRPSHLIAKVLHILAWFERER